MYVYIRVADVVPRRPLRPQAVPGPPGLAGPALDPLAGGHERLLGARQGPQDVDDLLPGERPAGRVEEVEAVVLVHDQQPIVYIILYRTYVNVCNIYIYIYICVCINILY